MILCVVLSISWCPWNATTENWCPWNATTENFYFKRQQLFFDPKSSFGSVTLLLCDLFTLVSMLSTSLVLAVKWRHWCHYRFCFCVFLSRSCCTVGDACVTVESLNRKYCCTTFCRSCLGHKLTYCYCVTQGICNWVKMTKECVYQSLCYC